MRDLTPDMEDERRVVFLAGILGFLGEDRQFYGIRGVSKARKKADEGISEIIGRLDFSEERLKKVRDKVEKGKLKVVVLSPEEMEDNKRKCLESETRVNREALFTLQENAMGNCLDCKRNRSKCLLRKALLKSKAPWANDGKGKCQFNWTEE